MAPNADPRVIEPAPKSKSRYEHLLLSYTAIARLQFLNWCWRHLLQYVAGNRHGRSPTIQLKPIASTVDDSSDCRKASISRGGVDTRTGSGWRTVDTREQSTLSKILPASESIARVAKWNGTSNEHNGHDCQQEGEGAGNGSKCFFGCHVLWNWCTKRGEMPCSFA